MKKVYVALGAALLAMSMLVVPAFAANTHGDPESTTLDACGYFVGTQTASVSHTSTSDGVTSTTEHGAWTGVLNNYVLTPVDSLGDVHGAYSETTTTDANGVVTGVETFTSNAGQISQTFTFGPGVPGGYMVSVTATRDLSFLTSDTNGQCYTGPIPRP